MKTKRTIQSQAELLIKTTAQIMIIKKLITMIELIHLKEAHGLLLGIMKVEDMIENPLLIESKDLLLERSMITMMIENPHRITITLQRETKDLH